MSPSFLLLETRRVPRFLLLPINEETPNQTPVPQAPFLPPQLEVRPGLEHAAQIFPPCFYVGGLSSSKTPGSSGFYNTVPLQLIHIPHLIQLPQLIHPQCWLSPTGFHPRPSSAAHACLIGAASACSPLSHDRFSLNPLRIIPQLQPNHLTLQGRSYFFFITMKPTDGFPKLCVKCPYLSSCFFYCFPRT